MFKRIAAFLLCLSLLVSSVSVLAEGANVTTNAVYDAADSVGEVVNADAPPKPTDEEKAAFAISPMDVVLVLDASGSMDRRHSVNNKMLLSYAQDAAIAFSKTLFSINPESRVAVVSYESDARKVADFTDISHQDSLYGKIRNISLGNMTNTGGGMALALSMLEDDAIAGRQRTILLLSDGLANMGPYDGVQYAVDQGYLAAQQGLVYTIGLVGGMDEYSKITTRQTLAPGYETRYFEVDFEDVGDITSSLASAFMTIAMAGSTISDDAVCYRLQVEGSMELYIENDEGEYLSSAAWDYKDTASFGSFYILGDDMADKMVVLYGDDYRITLHGTTTGKGLYVLTELRGAAAEEKQRLRRRVDTHPAMYQTVRLKNGKVSVTDQSYNPIDIYAIDPFTGEQTHGLEIPALGQLTAAVAALASPDNAAEKICQLKKGASISIFALDTATGYYYISFSDDQDYVSRGWVHQSKIETDGYVPEMKWLDQAARLSEKTDFYRTPSTIAPAAGSLDQNQQVVIRHAERDTNGNEWVYVQPKNNKNLVYIPAKSIEGWKPQTSRDFRLGYATTQYVWRKSFGAGFTEAMWAIPQKDGDGVILSGRTTSNKAPFKKNNGDRDAFVLTLDPSGKIGQTVTAGGSGMDSFHCIQAARNGYYISGITRSNDKDFNNTWMGASTTGKRSSKLQRTNALIGHLNDDLSIHWIRSLGVGDVPFGFDMVVQLADGSIAGVGWMTASSKSTVRGNGQQDFYVAKMTTNGRLVEAACFGSSVNDIPDSAVATPDGGLIIAGSHRRNGHSDGWIVVLDENLNMISEVSYGGSGEDVFDNIRLLADGSYLVTGFTNSPSGNGIGEPKGGTDFWAMNIDTMGRSIWVKRYGGSGDEELCGTTVLDNGCSLLLGSTTSTNGDVMGARGSDKDAWAICIDENGRLLWQYASGLAGDDSFNAAAVDPSDSCYVLAGLCNNTSDKVAEGLAIKLLPYATR